MNLLFTIRKAISFLAFTSLAQADPVAQQAFLRAPNPMELNRFGEDIDLDGDTLITSTSNSSGSNAAVHVYVREGEAWIFQDTLRGSNLEEGENFGRSVAIDGDTAVVGAPGEWRLNSQAEESGAVYVFVREGDTWTQQAYLQASNAEPNDAFGNEVAIDGNTIIVGASLEDSAATGVNGDQSDNSAENAGAAYVFVRNGSEWSQQAYLKASNPDANDRFAFGGLDIDDDTIVVGASLEASASTGVNGDQSDNSAGHFGAAYVFVRNGTEWSQQAYLKPSSFGPRGAFGLSVAVSGDSLVVSDHEADGFAGAAYVFVREAGQWREQARLKASNSEASDVFGFGLSPGCAIEGNAIVIGAVEERSAARGVNGNSSDNSVQGAGAAYVFTRNGETWTEQAYLKSAAPRPSALFGWSVALSHGTAAIGALEFESSTGGSVTLFTLGDLAPTNPFDIAVQSAGLSGEDSLPDASPFRDGVSNLLKFAFNMNLAGSDSHVLESGTGTSGLPNISVTSDGESRILRYEFLRRIGSGLVYTPLVSETLVPGSWLPIPESPEIIPINADWERAIYEHAIAKDEKRKFGAVRVRDLAGD